MGIDVQGSRATLTLVVQLALLSLLSASARADERADAVAPSPTDVSERDPSASSPSAPSESPAVDDGAANDPPAFGITVREKRPLSRDRSADALELDGERLRSSTSPSLLEAIGRETADVYVSSRGLLHGVSSGASGGIQIRGLGGSPNSQVLVVEDGAPDYQGIFGHPLPDAYLPFLIDRVLVIKGGDSALYGTNALGGVIVIENRWREAEGFELQSDTAFGSYSTVRQSAAALSRSGDLQLVAGFSTLQSDGHREGAGGGATVGTIALRHSLAPGLQLSLRNKLVHLAGADPGPITHPNPDHGYEVWRDNLSLQLLHRSPGLRLRLVPYFSLGIHRLHDGFRSRDHVGGAIAESEWRLIPPLALLTGLAFEGVEGVVEDRIAGTSEAIEGNTSTSAYAQLTYRPFSSLVLVAGGRLLHSSLYGPIPLFKLGGRVDLAEGLYFHGRVARNFRQPTLRELYLPFPTANPALQPERATNWDLGLGYTDRVLDVSLSGYVSDAEHLIRYFGAWPTAQVLNIDRLVVPGIEGRVGLRGVGPISLSLVGDVQRVGRYTRQNPAAKVGFILDHAREGGVGATLSGEWVHGLYMANYGRQPMEDVFVMDLSVRRRFVPPGQGIAIEPYLLVRNFIDREYAYIAGYRMPGINALAGLRLIFDSPGKG